MTTRLRENTASERHLTQTAAPQVSKPKESRALEIGIGDANDRTDQRNMRLWLIRFVVALLSIGLTQAGHVACCENLANLPPCCSITHEVPAVVPQPIAHPEQPGSISIPLSRTASGAVATSAGLCTLPVLDVCLIPLRRLFVRIHVFLI